MSETYDHPRVIGLQDSGTAEAGHFRTVFLRVAPAMFLATLDQTIVAPALPVIGSSLGSLAQIAWVITAYLLAATVAAPVYGRMGDAFGCKRMLLWALGLFLAGSIACAVARTMLSLVLARGLQGFGGGGLVTLAQALIGGPALLLRMLCLRRQRTLSNDLEARAPYHVESGIHLSCLTAARKLLPQRKPATLPSRLAANLPPERHHTLGAQTLPRRLL